MTISNTPNLVVRAGNDTATDFTFPFTIFSRVELVVTLIAADGSETDLTYGSGTTNYTVTPDGDYPSKGYVTYPASGSTRLATGEFLRLRRATVAEQLATLRNQGGYHPQTIERQLDRLTAIAQDQIERIDRSIKITRGSDELDTSVVVRASDAGKAIVINATGDGFDVSEIGGQGPQGPAGPQGPQGPAGSGSGDMIAANNLSDLVNKATARSNLGVAIGADVQAHDATLTALAGLTIAANKIIKGTGPDAFALLDFLDEDDFASDSATGLASQQSTKAYIAAQVTANKRVTGEVVDYVGSTAPSGWVFLDGRSIGDASSAATSRANADTEALFTLLWNSMADAQAPVSSGRGASAAADFAAHKRLTLPDARDRVIAGKGDMSGSSANRLTNQSGGVEGDTLGASGGAETNTLTTSQIPAHTHSNSIDGNGVSVTGSARLAASGDAQTGTLNTGSTGGGGAHNNVQPTLILNKIVKL